jgi:hypothetical protein
MCVRLALVLLLVGCGGGSDDASCEDACANAIELCGEGSYFETYDDCLSTCTNESDDEQEILNCIADATACEEAWDCVPQ